MNLYFRLLRMLLLARSRRRVDLWATTSTTFRVWPSDLDTVGHMNNAKYLALMDLGRVDLMLRSGFWKATQDRGWYPVVAAQTIRYRRSLKPGQRFELRTRVLGHDERAMYLEQSFHVAGELYAHAVVQTRLLSKAGGTVDAAEVGELAGGWPAHLELPEWVADWAFGVRQAS